MMLYDIVTIYCKLWALTLLMLLEFCFCFSLLSGWFHQHYVLTFPLSFLFLLSHFLISKNSLIFWMFLFYSIPISIYSKKKKQKTNLDISSQEEFNGRDWLNDVKRAGRAKGKRGRYPRIRKLPMLKAHTHCCSAGSMAPATTALEPHQCYWAGIRSPRSSQCCCSHHWHRGGSCHPLLLLLPKALPKQQRNVSTPTCQAPPAFSIGRT